jgi:A/G-specific adenine glycosylase
MSARSTISVATPRGVGPRSVPPTTSGKNLAAFRRALLRWYDQHGRDLPWRESRDPYRIWISEIMLQQTRVAAVLDHYRIFLDRFPNVEALAASSEDAVLAAWSGLGYYRRARMLHLSAKELVRTERSRFPQRADALRNLPGIGRYTAAAIASIAFGEPVAVVDGNVERVLKRFVVTPLTAAQIWQQAQALLSSSRPGDFNQAMMELGATVCVPGEPRCPMCPVRKWCAMWETSRCSSVESSAGIAVGRDVSGTDKTAGTTAARQSKRNRSKEDQVKKEIWCVLNQRKGDIRLVLRSKTVSLMPGMWELPQSPDRPRIWPDSEHWRTFRHSITVTDYTVHVLRSKPLRNPSLRIAPIAGIARGRWVPIDRIPFMPITGLTRKILRASGII